MSFDDNTVLIVKVYDMAGLYDRLILERGDCLELTCDSWINAEFSLSRQPESERLAKFAEIVEWIDRIEYGLEASFKGTGPDVRIEQQLAEGFYAGGSFLLKQPYIHVGGFLAQSKKVKLSHNPGLTILWRSDEDPLEEMHYNYADLSGGTDEGEDAEPGSVQWLLGFIGSDLCEADLVAFMLDELYSGRGDMGNVLARCFGDKLPFLDSEPSGFGGKLLDAMNSRWTELKEGYNRFADNERGRLRSELLKIKDKQLRFVRSLEERGVDPSDLPKDKVSAIIKLNDIMTGMLRTLEVEDLSKDDVDKSLSALEVATSVIDQLASELEDHDR